jgi:hypothetical protein
MDMLYENVSSPKSNFDLCSCTLTLGATYIEAAAPIA